MRKAIQTALFCLLICMMSVPQLALAKDVAGPKKLGEFNGWEVFKTMQADHPTCYMTLRPNKQEYKIIKAQTGKDKKMLATSIAGKRNDIYMMITFRPSESMSPVFSYRAGYVFKSGSEVTLKAGDKPYNLFTDKDQAWARSGAMDITITNAVRKAKAVLIQGGSNEGGKSTDIFNPEGVENAYKAVTKACGIT